MKETLVLIPGVGNNKMIWKYQDKYLTDTADIIIPSIDKCKTRKEMAEVVLATTDKPFSLAGTSMGAWVAFYIAAKYPERVNRLAVMNSWFKYDEEKVENQRNVRNYIQDGNYNEFADSYMKYAIVVGKRQDKDFLDLIKDQVRRGNDKVLVKHLKAYVEDFGSEEFIKKIKCPTLVIAAKDDTNNSVEEQIELSQSIKNARLVEVDNCGNFAPFEQPQAISALLRYWIKYF
jgi:pimeloyl-ACP methyl ester carboxylesterase